MSSQTSSPTSGPLDHRPGNGPVEPTSLEAGAPSQLEELFGSKSIFDFAELVKDTIPIDPNRG